MPYAVKFYAYIFVANVLAFVNKQGGYYMLRNSINTASFFTVLTAVLIFSLSLGGVAAAQNNTSLATGALQSNTTGCDNTALGAERCFSNTTAYSSQQHRQRSQCAT